MEVLVREASARDLKSNLAKRYRSIIEEERTLLSNGRASASEDACVYTCTLCLASSDSR